MKRIFTAHILLGACISLLLGCASTGDPGAGGIFWSESKAQERQQDLRAESHFSWQQAKHEEAAGTKLRQRRSSLRADIATQRQKLASMESELGELRQNAADVEVASTAAKLEGKRSALATSDSGSAEQLQKQVSDLQSEISRLKERNKLLKETR